MGHILPTYVTLEWFLVVITVLVGHKADESGFETLQLAKLYNNSLATGKITVEWKSSVICQIYKKGSRNNVTNYIPIGLTSVACKILERIVKANILQSASILSDAQHGFMPRRSCFTNLIVAEELITGMTDQGEPVDVVYLDV